MKVVFYNPLDEIATVQKNFNRLVDEVLEPGRYSRFPVAELLNNADNLVLKLELPGINVNDLDVQVTEDSVSVTGERKSETATEDSENVQSNVQSNFKSEFYYGKFHRVIPLPARVQNQNVTAEYKDGILNLTLPKADNNKPVKVSVINPV
jgi:HSP20 family protein